MSQRLPAFLRARHRYSTNQVMDVSSFWYPRKEMYLYGLSFPLASVQWGTLSFRVKQEIVESIVERSWELETCYDRSDTSTKRKSEIDVQCLAPSVMQSCGWP